MIANRNGSWRLEATATRNRRVTYRTTVTAKASRGSWWLEANATRQTTVRLWNSTDPSAAAVLMNVGSWNLNRIHSGQMENFKMRTNIICRTIQENKYNYLTQLLVFFYHCIFTSCRLNVVALQELRYDTKSERRNAELIEVKGKEHHDTDLYIY